MSKSLSVRRSVHALLIVASLAMADPLPAFANEAHRFDIAADSNTQAIQDFAAQSGVQILASVDELEGRQLHSVSGTLSTDEGLKAMLDGTGLKHQYVAERVVALLPASDESAREDRPGAFWERFRLASGAAVAADAESSQSSTAEAAPEEVVVEGQKLQEGSVGGWIQVPTLELPRTVIVIDEDTLSKQFVGSIKDIMKNAPGVQVVPDNNLAGYSTPTIRGVPAGSYFEGHNAGIVTGLPEAIGRTEVLEGFNSLQFGLDSGGGAVNFFLKRPTGQSFLKTELQTSNWGGGKLILDGDFHLDTGETDGVRFVGVLDRSQSYVRGYPDTDGKKGSLIVRYSGLLGFTIDADVSAWKIDNDPSGQYIDFVNAPNIPKLPDFNPRRNLTQKWSENSQRKGYQMDLRVSHKLGEDWTVTAETSLDRLRYRDDGCRVTAPDFATGETFYNCFKSGFGPLWDRHTRFDLSGRYTLFNMQNIIAFGYRTVGQSYKQIDDRTAYDFAPYTQQNIYNPRQYPEPTTGTFSPANHFRSASENELWYLQNRLSFNPQWDLWVGVGYVDQHGHYGGPTFPIQRPPGTHEVLPTGGLVYKPNSSSSYYVSYSEGLSYSELVSPNDPNVVNAGELLPGVHSRNYEIGAKWILLNRLQLNVAAFKMQQPFNITEQVENNPPRFRRFKGGLNEFTGFSVDFAGKLLSNLSVQGGFALVDPVQKDTQDPTLEGNKAAGVSKRSGTLNVNWDVGMPSGLSLDGGFYYQGSMPLNVTNTYRLDGFVRLDLGATYDTKWNDRDVRYRLLLENAMDSRFYYGFIYGFQVAAPRTLNASVSVRF